MKLDSYKLNDFGLEEHKDSLVPINILLVLIGFCILLFNKAIDFWGDPIRVSSVICGANYLIAYMFYLSEYYEKIWVKYYSLPSDKIFFRIYSLLIGVIVITLMQSFPEYWYCYTFVLLVVMYIKKRSTRRAFQLAFNQHCGEFEECEDNKLKAQYVLSHAFTVNFFKYGVLLNAAYAVPLFVLHKYNPTEIIMFFDVPVHLNYYVLFSGGITIPIVSFWIKKVSTGLTIMANKVEEGDYDFFREKI